MTTPHPLRVRYQRALHWPVIWWRFWRAGFTVRGAHRLTHLDIWYGED